jgi:copper chaperone CopZ
MMDEALSGLPGVKEKQIEYHEDRKGQDQVRVTYDPDKLTPAEILKAIRKAGFQGTIVPNQTPKKKP